MLDTQGFFTPPSRRGLRLQACTTPAGHDRLCSSKWPTEAEALSGARAVDEAAGESRFPQSAEEAARVADDPGPLGAPLGVLTNKQKRKW